MLGIYRKEYLVRIVVMTAMVWGFALPVVHLVCGMTVERESVVCDGHPMTDGQHASPAHAGMDAVDHESTIRDTDLHAPPTTVQTRDVRVECCWVDANAVDRRAPLSSLTQMPDLVVSHSDVETTYDLPEARATDLAAEDDTSPPIAFRLLFSVFLI